jgi:hypothetical protein
VNSINYYISISISRYTGIKKIEKAISSRTLDYSLTLPTCEHVWACAKNLQTPFIPEIELLHLLLVTYGIVQKAAVCTG